MGEVEINIKKNMQGVVLSCFFLILTFLCFPALTFGASYAISPTSGSYEVGKNFSVQVMVNASGDAPNSGSGSVTFDSTKLTAVSVSDSGSPFNLWITGGEPTIKGNTVTFEGGGFPGITGSKAIFTITFKGKAEGSAAVNFSNMKLLGGPGQDVLSGSTGATYTITAGSSDPEPTKDDPPKEERNVKIPPPEAPVIKSSTHPEGAEAWYPLSNAKFNWDIPYGVLGVRYGFDQDQSGTSTILHEPPIGEWKTENISDGIWYFHAEYRNRGGWGSSTTYTIQVDRTPPEEFSVSANGGDLTIELRFEAHDALSGISMYQIMVDGGRARDVQPTELTDGYRLVNLDPGEHTVKITAFDRAGNERSAEASAVVTGTKPVEEEVTTSGFNSIYWISLLFMAALAVVITMLIQERRKYHEEKDHIKRETSEIGDRLINIFGVLRDEIEEKVTDLSHKPNMTDNERNILEGLKDALDISEELIDKEVEDVRKLLK